MTPQQPHGASPSRPSALPPRSPAPDGARNRPAALEPPRALTAPAPRRVLFGYSGKNKIVGEAKGTGEAEEYWQHFLGLLKDSEVQFSLVRITMGDAESRRPKFVFITWLGTSVGVMARSRGGMHKADLKSVMGQFHVEMSTDATDEIALDLVKKKLKKSMGADYVKQ